MKTRIMLVDDSTELLNEMSDYFNGREDFEVVATAENGVAALEKFSTAQPDILLLDLVMPQMDGFGVMERLEMKNTKVVILSALSQDTFISRAMALGAQYYMIKPVSLDNLADRLLEAVRNPAPTPAPAQNGISGVKSVKNRSMEEKITNIFITVGIPAHIKGYQFLREAIKMAIDNPEIINTITKRLYPEVARKFETSPSKVERAIRHAIEVAWNRGKIENINTLFGVRVYNHNEKPTNGEFIALVADKMLLESV